MKIIAFFNVKGGVGKTTSAVNVAYNLASLHKKKTLLIDVDPQSNASQFYKSDENEFIIEDVLRGYRINEYSEEEPVTIDQAIAPTEYKNLDIIPTRNSLWGFERELLAADDAQQYKLKNAIDSMQHNYDYIVVDCTNVAGNLVNLNVFAVADYVFVPLKDEAWAGKGLMLTRKVIDEMYDYNPNLKLGGCFYCAWEKRKVNFTAFDCLKSILGDSLLDIKIRKNKSISEMSYVSKPLTLYDRKGTATQDYIDLTKKIIEIVEK